MKTKIIMLVIFYLITIPTYYYFTHVPVSTHFITPIDNLIPVIPAFIIPYIFATLVFLVLPFFLLFKVNFEIFSAYLITQMIANLISYFIFFIFPTSVVRGQITGRDIFSADLRLLYAGDGAAGAFPSGHVFQSIIISYFLWVYFPVTKPYICVVLPLIIASTVLLKQHYLPDILGGIVVAIIAIYLGQLITPKFLELVKVL